MIWTVSASIVVVLAADPALSCEAARTASAAADAALKECVAAGRACYDEFQKRDQALKAAEAARAEPERDDDDTTLTLEGGKTLSGKTVSETKTGYIFRTNGKTQVIPFTSIIDIQRKPEPSIAPPPAVSAGATLPPPVAPATPAPAPTRAVMAPTPAPLVVPPPTPPSAGTLGGGVLTYDAAVGAASRSFTFSAFGVSTTQSGTGVGFMASAGLRFPNQLAVLIGVGEMDGKIEEVDASSGFIAPTVQWTRGQISPSAYLGYGVARYRYRSDVIGVDEGTAMGAKVVYLLPQARTKYGGFYAGIGVDYAAFDHVTYRSYGLVLGFR